MYPNCPRYQHSKPTSSNSSTQVYTVHSAPQLHHSNSNTKTMKTKKFQDHSYSSLVHQPRKYSYPLASSNYEKYPSIFSPAKGVVPFVVVLVPGRTSIRRILVPKRKRKLNPSNGRPPRD